MSETWNEIDYQIEAEIVTGEDGPSWHYVVMPESAERFGKAKPVKVQGAIDHLAYEGTMLPMGGGTHLMAIRADARKKLKKSAGDTVKVAITGFK